MSNRWYFIKFCICNYILNATVLEFVWKWTNYIIGQNGSFTNYGWDALNFLLYEENKHDQINPLEKVFPKMTKCTFKRFGPTASIETNDALCTIPLNMLNEKFFIVLWFLYWGLRIFLIIGVVFRLALMFIPCVRFLYYAIDLNIDYATIRYLDKDMTLSDWFVISQLKENIISTIFYPFMDKIVTYQKYKEEEGEDFDIYKYGLNKGRKDALIFCAEKFKSQIPHISIKKPRQTKGRDNISVSAASRSTTESSLSDQV